MVVSSGLSHAGEFVGGVDAVVRAAAAVEPEFMPFGAGSVVREKEYERVFQLSVVAQRFDKASDIAVHNVDHGRIDGHASCQVVLLFFRKLFPGRDRSCAVDELACRHYAPAGGLLFVGQQSQTAQTRLSLLPDRIPAFQIDLHVMIDAFAGSLQREMRGVVCHVQEERFVQFARPGCEIDGIVGDGVRGVKFTPGIFPPGRRFGQTDVAIRIPVGHGAAEESVEIVEAAVYGGVCLSHVPFACHGGMITGCPERFGDGEVVVLAIAPVALGPCFPVVAHHFADTYPVGVEPRQQAGPRGAAASRIVELREAQAFGRQPVQCGGFDFASEASRIGKAEVVGQDDDDVGLCLGGLGRYRSGGGQRGREEESPGIHGRSVMTVNEIRR